MRSRPSPDDLTDALLRWTVPQDEPPRGARPTADELAALGEGRLSPTLESALLRRIEASAAAREELRALYPARHAALFVDAPAPAATVLQFPRRTVGIAAGLTAAAAAAAIVLLPTPPPEGAQLDVFAESALERGAADTVRPGGTLHIAARIGTPSWRASLRGEAAWAVLLHVDPIEQIGLICAPGACAASDDTLAFTWQAPATEGRHAFILVSGVGDPPGLAGVPDESALRRWAEREGWSLQTRAVVVR